MNESVLSLSRLEDFYNFVELLCPTSTTSGIAVAETLFIHFSTRIAIVFHFSNAISSPRDLLFRSF